MQHRAGEALAAAAKFLSGAVGRSPGWTSLAVTYVHPATLYGANERTNELQTREIRDSVLRRTLPGSFRQTAIRPKFALPAAGETFRARMKEVLSLDHRRDGIVVWRREETRRKM